MNKSNNLRGYNVKYLPYVLTEQGIMILSGLLKSANELKYINKIWEEETRKNRNRIRFENGGHYVSDDTMDNVYSKDIFEYTKTDENFGYLLVAEQTIPVYTIVNDKTLSEIELNKFLEYNVNKVIEYYNDFKEGKTWN